MLMVSLLLLPPAVNAQPVVIYGNANGLWSPTHPHVTNGNVKPKVNSPVLYIPLEPKPEVATESQDICPTLQSAPHLCQSL